MPTVSWASFHLADFPSVTGSPAPITAASVGGFLYALFWAWILLVSFTGWGRFAGKLARVPRLPSSVACSLGIAVVIFLGGILNLLDALYVPVLLALAAIGFALYLWLRGERPAAYRWKRFWDRTPSIARILIVAALILLALRVAATVRLGAFNNLDDGPAYLVFPHKLLAAHSFAFDPFSNRRVISSLGGAYFLQAMVIAATSLAHIGMADRTLGLLLLAAALFDLGIAFDLPAIWIAILEFVAFLVPQPAINLTFVVLPTSLLLAMIWFILRSESSGQRARYAWFAGVVGGGVICLKSTFLPAVCAFALISYLLLPSAGKWTNRARWPLVAGAGALAVVAAWMAAMKIDSGTYLFPLFGSGVNYSSYVLWTHAKFTSTRSVVKVFLQAIPLFVLAAIQAAAGIRDRRARLSFSILIASAVAITAFNYKTGGDFIWRYNFPQFFVAILIFYAAAAALHRGSSGTLARARIYLGAASLIAMIFYYDASGSNARAFRQVHVEQGAARLGIRASLSGTPLSSQAIVAEYRAVEKSIPKYARAIENTAYPFLFHYRNRTIFLMDWPGAASPKPGWPLGGSLDEVVDYLKSKNIRYVVYGYRYGHWADMEGCEALKGINANSAELLALWRITLVTHDELDRIRTQYRSVYDDGNIAVIDLDRPLGKPGGNLIAASTATSIPHPIPKPVSDPRAPRPLWTLHADVDSMCSEVMARYHADFRRDLQSGVPSDRTPGVAGKMEPLSRHDAFRGRIQR